MKTSAKHLFYTAWFLYLTSFLLIRNTSIVFTHVSFYRNASLIIELIALGLVVAKIAIYDKWDVRSILATAVLGGFVLFVWLNIGYATSVPAYFVFIVGSRNIGFEDFIKFDVKIRCVGFILVILLFSAGVFQNYEVLINGHLKNSYGFSHPNTLTAIFAVMLMELLYLFGAKRKRINVFILACFSVLLYFFWTISAARTYIYIAIFVSIAMYVANKFDKKKVEDFMLKIKPICISSPFILLAASIFLTHMYATGDSFYRELNSVLTGRLYWNNLFYDVYGISVFGQELPLVSGMSARLNGGESLILDNMYYKLIIEFGIIFAFMFFIFCSACISKAIKSGNYRLIILISAYLIIGIASNAMMNLSINLTLFSFTMVLSTSSFQTPEVSRTHRLSYRNLSCNENLSTTASSGRIK